MMVLGSRRAGTDFKGFLGSRVRKCLKMVIFGSWTFEPVEKVAFSDDFCLVVGVVRQCSNPLHEVFNSYTFIKINLISQ